MADIQSKNPTMEKLLASLEKKPISLSRGQEVEGEVVAVADKEIILDLGAKSEGVLNKRDLLSLEVQSLNIGDKIRAFVIDSESDSGQVILSTKQASPKLSGSRPHSASWNRFILARDHQTKLSGQVIEVNKGGLIIEIDGIRGFLPNSQVGFELISKAKDGMSSLAGENLTVGVIEVDINNNRLIFSQKGQLSQEVKKKLEEFEVGQKIKGKVIAVMPFGLFIDLNGIGGLVFIGDVSWERQEDLNALFKIGQEIEAVVLSKDEDFGRVNLSIKQLQKDPLESIAEKYQADDVVKAIVSSVSDSGVVFKLEDGVEGFIPSSKLDTDSKYEVGQAVSVLVDSIDKSKRRVNLSPFVTTTKGLIYK